MKLINDQPLPLSSLLITGNFKKDFMGGLGPPDKINIENLRILLKSSFQHPYIFQESLMDNPCLFFSHDHGRSNLVNKNEILAAESLYPKNSN